MSEKILVADDSPTIQKVVGITLAKSDYQLVEALNLNELLENLKTDQFDLVLLDFNLSQDDDGYEICRQIKDISPSTRILTMLGTFDTVDETRLGEMGIFEHVVKPFESSIFIQNIKECLNRSPDNLQEAIELDAEDEWSMSGTQQDDEDMSEELSSGTLLEEGQTIVNELRSEVEGWGMSVPNVIGVSEEEDNEGLMPPQMGAPNSQMVSIDELMNDAQEEEEVSELTSSEEDTGLDLASELEDESEASEFWAVDEEVQTEDVNQVHINLESEISDEDDFVVEEHAVIEEIGPKLEKDENFTPIVSALNDLHEQEDTRSATIDTKSLLEELRPQLKAMIKEVIEEMGNEATERVAWEVIPDLAENLIRKEVQNLSKKVQDKHSLS